MTEGIPSKHGKGEDDERDGARSGPGGVPSGERQYVEPEDPLSEDSAEQPHGGGMAVRGHQHVEGGRQRDTRAEEVQLEHLSPDDPQPPLIPLSRAEVTSYTYRGPIPDPGMLARYNEVDPTFADRIMRMAESEVEARTDSMKRLNKAEARAVSLGAVTTAAIVVLGLVAAIVLIALGYDGIAFLLAVPALLYGVARVIEAIRNGSSGDSGEDGPPQS